jgi:hypothetical protein
MTRGRPSPGRKRRWKTAAAGVLWLLIASGLYGAGVVTGTRLQTGSESPSKATNAPKGAAAVPVPRPMVRLVRRVSPDGAQTDVRAEDVDLAEVFRPRRPARSQAAIPSPKPTGSHAPAAETAGADPIAMLDCRQTLQLLVEQAPACNESGNGGGDRTCDVRRESGTVRIRTRRGQLPVTQPVDGGVPACGNELSCCWWAVDALKGAN